MPDSPLIEVNNASLVLASPPLATPLSETAPLPIALGGTGASPTLLPGASKYYGTNASNVLGYYALPSFSAPSGAQALVYATPAGMAGSASLRALVFGDLPAIPFSGLTSKPTTIAGYGIADGATQGYANAAAAAVKTGTIVTLGGLVSGGGTWSDNDCVGVAGFVQGSQSDSVAVPWMTRVPGTLLDVGLQSLSGTSSNATITVIRAAGGNSMSFTYSATTLTFVVANTEKSGGDSTHSVHLDAGDCILTKLSSALGVAWSTGGLIITGRFIPDNVAG